MAHDFQYPPGATPLDPDETEGLDVRYWTGHKTYSPDEIAVRFHHKLVWIHLFANGNGRHARLMTDLLLKEVLKEKPFAWNVGNMEDEDRMRDKYLEALRKADNHDYSLLLGFVRRKG
ncbi:MAG: mobile mystery protein B [Candidatus Omnitrophica bacterium]|nr:mobile mystery protein B [Candidatus Omnitrophota bacterium]